MTEQQKPTRSTPQQPQKDTRDTTSSESELPEYEEAVEQGYLGEAQDPRPNEAYTVEGVTARAENGPPNITEETNPPEAEQRAK